MNKQKLIWVLVAAAAVLALAVGLIVGLSGGHDCQSQCSQCGKCTDAACTDSACAQKCPGHGHTCQNVCEACGKCTDADCKDPACSDKCSCAYTLSGLVGDGYSFTAEGHTVSEDGKLRVEPGTQLKLQLVLDDRYCTGVPVVKLNGSALTGKDGVYTCTVDANGAITVEGLLLYEMVIRNPFNVTPTGTTAEELGTTMSEVSNIITAEWHAKGHLFGNVKLERYLSVVFYAKADNAWISFRDKLGEFNELDTPIYANGVTNPETGVSEPDSLWHKYEFRRETDAEGKISYRLYVDGKMHTHFDAANEVDARVRSKLTDFLLDLNGTYYVSELFGCLDPEYKNEGGGLEIYTQSPLVTPQDDYSTEDYPCEESLRINVFNRPQWGREQLISLPLAPYSEVKFYITCPASGWIVGTINGKDVATFAAGTGWHEFLIQKEGDKFALWVDGQDTGEYFGYNLNELVLTLNDATYYVSELFVAADPDYVPERYDQVTTKDPIGQSSSAVKGETPVDYITEMYRFTPADWSNLYFKALNALEYEQLRFFVRSAGKEDTWLQVALGAEDLLATNDSEWHEVALIKVDGYAAVYIDGVQKAKVTDLAQLRLVLTGGGTYYYTDFYGVKDADYVPVTLSGPSGEGYRIEFVGAYAVDNVATLEKGANVSFRVLLSLDYDKSNYTVKVNGEKVTAEEGIYTITLTKNSTIKVEGVKENPNPYTMILQNPFEIQGEETKDVLPEGFDHVTKLTTTWNRYSFVPVNLNKYTEVRFSVYSGGWFGLMDGDVVIDETTSNGQWLRIRLVRVEEGWQVWYNDKDEGVLLLPYNNLSDLGFRFGENVYYVTELKGLEDPNYSENPTKPQPDPNAPADPYKQVLEHPFVLDGTATDDVVVNGYDRVTKLTTTWNAYGFKSLSLAPYTEVKFAVKSSGWFGVMIGSSVIDETKTASWLEIRLVREDGGWRLYYGEKDEGLLTLISNDLSDLGFRFGDATYYVTELKALEDPDYDPNAPVEPDPGAPEDPYDQALEHPFQLEGTVSPDIHVAGYEKVTVLTTGWNKYNFKPLDLTPYTEVKFAIKSGAWYGVMADGSTVIDETSNAGWLEIRLVREEGGWRLYYGDKDEGLLTLANNNLTDLNFRLGDSTHYVTDLRVLADPNYVKPEFELIASGDPLNKDAAVSDVLPDADFVTESWKFEPAQWTSVNFPALSTLPYEQIKFYLKSDGPDSKWISLQVGTTPIMQVNDTVWHEIWLKKANGVCNVLVDGVQKAVITDMAQLNMALNEGTAYYYTGFYGIEDADHQKVELTVPSGDGYSITVDTVYVSGGIAALEKGTVVTFRVTLDELYNQSALVVKANGTAITAVDGVYTVTVSENTAITVEGVVENPVVHEPAADWSKDETGHWHACGHCEEKLDFAQHTPGEPEEIVTLEPAAHEPGSKDIVVKCTVCGYEISRETEAIPPTQSLYKPVVTNPLNNTPTSTAMEGLPSQDVNIINITNCGWTSPGLADGIILADWTELKLYYKVSDANKWFEMYDASGTALYQGNATEWTEIRFTLEGEVWTLYVGGEWKKSNLTGTTLKDIVATLTLGGSVTADVYVTDLVGLAVPHEPAADWSKDETGHWHACGHCDKKLDFAQHTPGEPEENVTLEPTATVPGSKDIVVKCTLCGYEISRETEEIPVELPTVTIHNNPFDLAGEPVTEDIPEGYASVTKLTTSWNMYNFLSTDLSSYTEVWFAVKSEGWYGVMYNGTVINETTSGDWLEIKLVKTAAGWDLYYGNVLQQSLTLANNNLTDLNFRFGSNTYYVTELKGKQAQVQEPGTSPNGYVTVTTNMVNTTPTSTTTEGLPSEDVTIINIINCGWISPGLVDGITMADWTELKLYYKVSDAGKWFEMFDASGAALYQGNATEWTEVRFTLEGEVWTLYVGGEWKKSNLTGTTLKDIVATLTLGGSVTADVYVTDVVGKPAQQPTEPGTSPNGYVTVTTNMVNTAPTSTTTEGLPSEDVTIINIINCGWTSPGLADGITMADWTELKLYYKVSDAGKWFEMFDASGTALYQGNATEWTEVRFTLEGEVWTLYVGGEWKKSNLTGTTLKDIVATLTLGGSVTADVYVTDVVGKPAQQPTEPGTSPNGYVTVTTNMVNAAPTSTTTEGLPSEDVTTINIINCGWTSPGLADGITMADWTELKLYYKVSDAGKWFEMFDASGTALYQGNATEWTEVRFTLEGEVWTLYVGGEWKKSNLTGTTLKDIVAKLTLGGSVTADVYVTDLIGLRAQ